MRFCTTFAGFCVLVFGITARDLACGLEGRGLGRSPKAARGRRLSTALRDKLLVCALLVVCVCMLCSSQLSITLATTPRVGCRSLGGAVAHTFRRVARRVASSLSIILLTFRSACADKVACAMVLARVMRPTMIVLCGCPTSIFSSRD